MSEEVIVVNVVIGAQDVVDDEPPGVINLALPQRNASAKDDHDIEGTLSDQEKKMSEEVVEELTLGVLDFDDASNFSLPTRIASTEDDHVITCTLSDQDQNTSQVAKVLTLRGQNLVGDELLSVSNFALPQMNASTEDNRGIEGTLSDHDQKTSEEVAKEFTLEVQNFIDGDELTVPDVSNFALSETNASDEGGHDVEGTLAFQNDGSRRKRTKRRKRKKISTSSDQSYDWHHEYLYEAGLMQPGSAKSDHKVIVLPAEDKPIDKTANVGTSCAVASDSQDKLWQILLPELLGDLAQPSIPTELHEVDPAMERANEIANPTCEMESGIVGPNNCNSADNLQHVNLRAKKLKRNETHPERMRRRIANRELAKLPMLACKDEFVRRLRSEKVLVVTAETGSGKTTQLPQYCAEEFPGLVICTQPRAIAATSVARRIAKEFDNSKVGTNVGYEARSGNKKQGQQIMIMTDAALIRMAQHDRLLKRVGVLIIDEAHERSLNTDIVVGIAKTVLEHRPDDFRVVIASATIDPRPFLDFFFDDPGERGSPPPLTVPGRVFPVTTETRVFGKSDDFSAALATEVVKTLKKRTLGHCLVFLQGAREVDAALACFQMRAPTNWVALPLYGTLSPEDQDKVLTFDDKQGSRRMVVFCTNVAETSLTVPDVRLVIDTGLAKESRYDPERRMTILEEVYISQSSAEQRKGRAGRTAEGHCVRLFAWDTLKRKNIEPEILRSSLDLVMLQVCSLGFDPLEFKFITRPDEALMRSSLAMLTEMGCLTSSFALTDRGLLFNNLPFDPRLSNFVVTAHEQFGQGSAAAVIAAIVSAPGSVIYFGNCKEDRRNPDSVGFSSDLLRLRSLYKAWLKSGEVDTETNNCRTCRKKISHSVLAKGDGCRDCRVKHTKANSLNNKVLDFVRATVMQVQKEIEKHKSSLSHDLPVLFENDIERVIGSCLAKSFPEQVCEFIMPSNPTVGVYAVASDLKGQLSYSSVLRIAVHGAKYFVAMSQTRLPSGLVLMDKAHSINLEWMPADAQQKVKELSLDTMECYNKENVSGRYCSCCRKYFSRILEDGEQYARFVVCQYDVTTSTLSVFAPQVNTAEVGVLCDALVSNAIEEDLAEEVVVDAFNGFATMTVAAGFNVRKIDIIEEQPCRVHFANPPVKSRNELLNWVCKISGCTTSDVKWCSYLPCCEDDGQDASTATGIVVFRQEDFATKAQSSSAATRVSEHGSYRALVKSMDVNVAELLGSCNVHPVKIMKIKPLRCQILIPNLPENMDERGLRNLLRRNGLPDPNYVKIPNLVNGRRNVIVTFNVQTANNDIISKCERIQELVRCRGKFWPAENIVFFQKCQEADDLYRLALRASTPFEVDGTAVSIVAHPEMFLLEEHLDSIASVNGVKYKLGRQLSKGKEVIFSDNLTSKCDDAVQALRKIVEPIQYFFGTRDRNLMGAELRTNGKLQEWAKKYGLLVEERLNREMHFTGIFVYGEKYQQGQFMAELAEYYNEFLSRYHLVGLSPAANCLFRKGNPGESELQKMITARRSDEVAISYQGFLSSIEIFVKPGTRRTPSVIVEESVSAIDDVLSKFNQKSAAAKNCVYCNVHPGRKFLICGHSYCRECLQQAVAMQLTSFSINKYLTTEEAEAMEEELRMRMGCCPLCKTRIAVKDLSHALTRSAMEKACMVFAQLVMRREDHPMGVCPMPKCSAFMPKQLGYSSCPCCKQLVCPKCGVSNDSRHALNTCEEYQKLLKEGTGSALLRSIVSKAKEFAEAHWRSNAVGKIVQIEINPGLERGCMALQRYCSGIQRIGLNELEKYSVFAWHGTPNEAIPGICEDGFDPGRRRTQLYGTGEYFGIHAETSISYTENCERLIVAQIIKCTAITEVTNFCYVVNNPTDWSYSFNLPLLVVTYGSSTKVPISWIWKQRRLLPYPFKDKPTPRETINAFAERNDVLRVNHIRVLPVSPPSGHLSNPLPLYPTHSNQRSLSYNTASSAQSQPRTVQNKRNCTIL